MDLAVHCYQPRCRLGWYTHHCHVNQLFATNETSLLSKPDLRDLLIEDDILALQRNISKDRESYVIIALNTAETVPSLCPTKCRM